MPSSLADSKLIELVDVISNPQYRHVIAGQDLLEVARAWHDAGYTAQDARAWWDAGCTTVPVADQLQALGLTSEQAATRLPSDKGGASRKTLAQAICDGDISLVAALEALGRSHAAAELRVRRFALDVTQGQLASALGVSSNTVARWERGEMSVTPIVMLALSELERRHDQATRQQLRPLGEWICDSCGKSIVRPADGWVEWQGTDNADGKQHIRGMRIVHHRPASPCTVSSRCQYHPTATRDLRDLPMSLLVGTDGLAQLLTMLDSTADAESRAQVLEVVRRLHIPYYEGARLSWERAQSDGYFAGANEYWPYTQEALHGIIGRYGRDRSGRRHIR